MRDNYVEFLEWLTEKDDIRLSETQKWFMKSLVNKNVGKEIIICTGMRSGYSYIQKMYQKAKEIGVI